MTNKKTKKTNKKSERSQGNLLEPTDFSFALPDKANAAQRKKIALDTLERYAGVSANKIQKYILLTNFPHYVDRFCDIMDVPLETGAVLKSAHCAKQKISIIDYRVGAPMAALIIDVLSYIEPQCVLMLGLCGGLHGTQKVGDFLLPVAAIRDEGASLHYMPPQVPSLPAFMIQQYISEELLANKMPFRTGVIHTTDYRMWEFDDKFKSRLRAEKATAIDMECSALFTAAFAKKVPVGALMLVSDLPFKASGIKTKKLAKHVFDTYTDLHLDQGIKSLKRMRDSIRSHEINFRRFHF